MPVARGRSDIAVAILAAGAGSRVRGSRRRSAGLGGAREAEAESTSAERRRSAGLGGAREAEAESTSADLLKPLLRLRDRPLVTWALGAARTSGLWPVLLVVGHEADAVGAHAPRGVEVVVSTEWELGIAHSPRAALAALSGRPAGQAVCIGLADQPLVGPEAYRRLAVAYDDGADLAVATYGGVRGNPVLLGRSRWGEAMRLEGDEGARVLFRRHPVVEVPCDGTGDPSDVDTLDDLRDLEKRCASRTSSG